jgi:hypothetical protein
VCTLTHPPRAQPRSHARTVQAGGHREHYPHPCPPYAPPHLNIIKHDNYRTACPTSPTMNSRASQDNICPPALTTHWGLGAALLWRPSVLNRHGPKQGHPVLGHASGTRPALVLSICPRGRPAVLVGVQHARGQAPAPGSAQPGQRAYQGEARPVHGAGKGGAAAGGLAQNYRLAWGWGWWCAR